MPLFLKIVLSLLLALLFCAGILYLGYRRTLRTSPHFTAVGTLLEYQPSKIPACSHAVVSYTRGGKPFTAMSEPVPNWEKKKVGSQKMYSIYHFKSKAGPIVLATKPVRPKNAKT